MNSSSKTYYTVIPVNPEEARWQPDATTNNKIHVESGITSNWKYRQYLQHNANTIMKYNTKETIHASGNNPYAVDNKTASTNVPHTFTSIHDTSSPSFGFNNSDLKKDYMTKQQMSARMISPSIPTNW